MSQSASSGVLLEDSGAQLNGVRLWGNRSAGLRVRYSSWYGSGKTPARVRHAEFSGNGLGVEHPEDSRWTGFRGFAVGASAFFGNRGSALHNGSLRAMTATGNWWGESDGSGPYHKEDHPTGKGGTVTGRGAVTYRPFLATPLFDYGYANFSQADGLQSSGTLRAPTMLRGSLSDAWGTGAEQSVARHARAVVLQQSGLDASKTYLVRVGYYRKGADALYQRMVTGTGDVVHGFLEVPQTATQYEFALPKSAYANGTLRLRIERDADNSVQPHAVLSELWLIEAKGGRIPPSSE